MGESKQQKKDKLKTKFGQTTYDNLMNKAHPGFSPEAKALSDLLDDIAQLQSDVEDLQERVDDLEGQGNGQGKGQP